MFPIHTAFLLHEDTTHDGEDEAQQDKGQQDDLGHQDSGGSETLRGRHDEAAKLQVDTFQSTGACDDRDGIRHGGPEARHSVNIVTHDDVGSS